MTAATQEFPKAFAVWFKDLKLWGVNSFFKIGWQWLEEFIKPLCTALKRKQVEVDRQETPLDQLQLITLHFDGSIEPRNLQGKSGFKGKLFAASPGDVIYSKIDVRNGAIGIVPDDMPLGAVSSEFPVYAVLPDVALPDYIKLVVRTKQFLQLINSMISGASGRKRVQPEQLEQIEIPLPPITIQRAIVDRWKTAQAELKAAAQRVEELKANIVTQFLQDLGLQPLIQTEHPKAFAVWWKDLFNWNGRSTYTSVKMRDLSDGKYPIVSGYDCLAEIKHGCPASPSLKPTGLEVLRISAVTKGEFAPNEKKYAFDKPFFRKNFDLKQGDVLMCRTNGTLAYVGMSALVKEDMEDLILPDKVIRVRTKENILPAYLWKLLQIQPLREQIEAAARTAVGNYAIGTQDIWNLQIPLPPLDVQKAIMQRVEVGRQAIAREREAADRKKQEIEAEIEALILGTQAIEVMEA